VSELFRFDHRDKEIAKEQQRDNSDDDIHGFFYNLSQKRT
jgi:hypothetical protein